MYFETESAIVVLLQKMNSFYGGIMKEKIKVLLITFTAVVVLLLLPGTAMTAHANGEKPLPDLNWFNVIFPADLTYDGNPKTVSVTTATELTGIGTITVAYYDSYDHQLTGPPVNPGTYFVGLFVTEGSTYAPLDSLLGSFVITGGSDTEDNTGTDTGEDTEISEPSLPVEAPYLMELYDSLFMAEALAERLNNGVTVIWDQGESLSYSILTLLQEMPNVSIRFITTSEGVDYDFTISGGRAFEFLEEGTAWYGPKCIQDAVNMRQLVGAMEFPELQLDFWGATPGSGVAGARAGQSVQLDQHAQLGVRAQVNEAVSSSLGIATIYNTDTSSTGNENGRGVAGVRPERNRSVVNEPVNPLSGNTYAASYEQSKVFWMLTAGLASAYGSDHYRSHRKKADRFLDKDATTPQNTVTTGTDQSAGAQTHNTIMGAEAGMAALSQGNDFVSAATEGLGLGSNAGTDGVGSFASIGGGNQRQETG